MTTTRWKVGARDSDGYVFEVISQDEIGEELDLVCEVKAGIKQTERQQQIVREHNAHEAIQADNRMKDQLLAVLEEQNEAMREALDKIMNLTNGHPIDADRRDRINTLARAALRLAKGE